MGNSDLLTTEYMRDKEHSADLLNYMLYSGNQIIKPDDLQELNPNIVYDCISYNNSDTIYNRIKDVMMKCTIMHDRTANYIIFSIENQTDINLTMPIRNMFSDSLQYMNQLEEFKKIHKGKHDLKKNEFVSGISENDKFLPVITVTVYWGADKWTAPKRLYEMLATSDKNVLKYVNNYDINLIEPASIDDFSKFSTELGAVFDFINKSTDKKLLMSIVKQSSDRFSDMSIKSVRLINQITGTKISLTKNQTPEGGIDVCEALQEIIEDEKKVIREKYEKEISERDNALAEKDNTIAEKDNALAEKDNTIAEKDNALAERDNTIAEKDNTIAEKDAEIAMLKKKLAR